MEAQSITILSSKGLASNPVTTDRVSSRESAHDFRNVMIVAMVAMGVLLPIMIFGIPNGADLSNHLRFALPFYESIQSGHFHPGWLAESNYGLGDPRFIFYPPGLYYLLSAARMITGGWYSASILTLVFLSIAGGLGAYFWARTVFNPSIAMWTGILYSLAPYRLNEIYQASLLSEYAACSILPFVFAFVDRVIKRKRFCDVVGLGATYALLILTHLPIALIGSIALTIYVLIRVQKKLFWPTIARLALGAVLGLAASSIFWTSMLAELSWIKGSAANPNPYYDYRLNFLFSPSALTNRNTWYANILALAMIGFLLPGVALLVRSFRRGESNRAINTALVLLLVTFLMATPLSKPIWAVVPKLSEVQFPWRWLAIPSLMGSLLLAISIPKWREQLCRFRPRDLAIGLLFALSLVFVGSQIIQDCDYLSRAKFDPMVQDLRGAVSFKDWLPVAARDFKDVEKLPAKVDAGTRSVTITKWEPEQRAFHVGAGSESTLRVQTYFYPRWTAKAEGRLLPITATAGGLLLISASAQATDIQLAFEPPARVYVFELVTAASWLLIFGFVLAAAIAKQRRDRPFRSINREPV